MNYLKIINGHIYRVIPQRDNVCFFNLMEADDNDNDNDNDTDRRL
jgi:hypothetical protein